MTSTLVAALIIQDARLKTGGLAFVSLLVWRRRTDCIRMKFLLLLVLFGFAHSNPDFELEVFSKTSQYVRDYTSTRSVPDVHKYIPEDAKILIKYAKRYFHEKKMLAAPPKVKSSFKKLLSTMYFKRFFFLFRLFWI